MEKQMALDLTDAVFENFTWELMIKVLLSCSPNVIPSSPKSAFNRIGPTETSTNSNSD
jgi:hypothetical protein